MTDIHELGGLEQSWLSRISMKLMNLENCCYLFTLVKLWKEKKNFIFLNKFLTSFTSQSPTVQRIWNEDTSPPSEHSKSSWRSNANVAKFKLGSGTTGKKSRPRCEGLCLTRWCTSSAISSTLNGSRLLLGFPALHTFGRLFRQWIDGSSIIHGQWHGPSRPQTGCSLWLDWEFVEELFSI